MIVTEFLQKKLRWIWAMIYDLSVEKSQNYVFAVNLSTDFDFILFQIILKHFGTENIIWCWRCQHQLAHICNK